MRRTASLAHTIMHAALDDAVAKGYLLKNPASKLKRRPKPPTRETDEYLTPERLEKVLNAAKGTIYWFPIFLAASTGMRRGEVCGLKW